MVVGDAVSFQLVGSSDESTCRVVVRFHTGLEPYVVEMPCIAPWQPVSM